MMSTGDQPPRIRALHAYWFGLGCGVSPDRGLVDLAALKPLLPYIVMSEFEDEPFRIRYRLTGTKVDEVTGFNLAGRYLDEFKDGDEQGPYAQLERCYIQCQADGQPQIGQYKWSSRDKLPLRIWFGIFPLTVDGRIRQNIAVEDYSYFPQGVQAEPWTKLYR